MEIMNTLTDVEIIIFKKLQEIVNTLFRKDSQQFPLKQLQVTEKSGLRKRRAKELRSKETIDAGQASLFELDRKLEGFDPTIK